jgi:hypothetical protein
MNALVFRQPTASTVVAPLASSWMAARMGNWATVGSRRRGRQRRGLPPGPVMRDVWPSGRNNDLRPTSRMSGRFLQRSASLQVHGVFLW